MSESWRQDALEILAELQRCASSRDAAEFERLYEDPAILIGTAADARDAEARHIYAERMMAQPEDLSWEWTDLRLYFEAEDQLGFAAFGDAVLAGPGMEPLRAPIRLSIFAVKGDGGWRLRASHGSLSPG